MNTIHKTHYNNEELRSLFKNMNFDWIHNNNDIISVISRLSQIEWYFVGGCVRDSLINKHTYDIDITTTSTPDVIEQLMHGFVITTIGKKFGTIGVYINKWKIEITTTRHDINPDGRHADVDFSASFYDDSCRRDFTVNGLLYNGKELIDWNGGIQDLIHQRIRFIGNPQQRIQEDYLRIIRYIRFFYRFYHNNKLEYLEEIQNSLPGLTHVSKERFLQEITSICNHPNYLQALISLNTTGLSKSMFGENMNVSKLQILFDNNFNDMDFIFAALFVDYSQDTIRNIPISKNVKKLINWIKNSENIILQCAKIYNSSKNIKYMLYFTIMRNKDLYDKISKVNIEFEKKDLMMFKEEYRSIANDLYTGVRILEYVKE